MLSADLSKYTQLDSVKRELPDQHLEVGMAEQNLLSVAAGVSKAGFLYLSPQPSPATPRDVLTIKC